MISRLGNLGFYWLPVYLPPILMGLGKSHIPSHPNPILNPICPIPFAIIPFQSQIPIPYPISHLPSPISHIPSYIPLICFFLLLKKNFFIIKNIYFYYKNFFVILNFILIIL